VRDYSYAEWQAQRSDSKCEIKELGVLSIAEEAPINGMAY